MYINLKFQVLVLSREEKNRLYNSAKAKAWLSLAELGNIVQSPWNQFLLSMSFHTQTPDLYLFIDANSRTMWHQQDSEMLSTDLLYFVLFTNTKCIYCQAQS